MKQKKSKTFNKHKSNMKLTLNYKFENIMKIYGKYTILSCSNFDSFKHITINVSMENIFLCLPFFVFCIMKMIEMKVDFEMRKKKKKKKKKKNTQQTTILQKHFTYLQHQYINQKRKNYTYQNLFWVIL